METYEMIDSVTGLVSQTKTKHDNAGYRNSQACWITGEVFNKVQEVAGVTEVTIDAVALCMDAINSKYNITLDKEAFNRSLTAHQARPAKADKTAVLSESDQYAVKYMNLLKTGKKHKDIVAEIGNIPQ
jgi:hypothetical protein